MWAIRKGKLKLGVITTKGKVRMAGWRLSKGNKVRLESDAQDQRKTRGGIVLRRYLKINKPVKFTDYRRRSKTKSDGICYSRGGLDPDYLHESHGTSETVINDFLWGNIIIEDNRRSLGILDSAFRWHGVQFCMFPALLIGKQFETGKITYAT